MPKPSALSALFKLLCGGTLLLFAAASWAAGQSSGPPGNPTESVQPQFRFSTGEPFGLWVEARGREAGILPSFRKGVDLPGAPQLQLHIPQELRTQPVVRVLISPSMPKFAQLTPPATAPVLNTSKTFNISAVQTAYAVIPPMANALPPAIDRQQSLCSVPLLRIARDPNKSFSIRQVPAPTVDPAMVVKPSAPACDEKTRDRDR
jgi:hypothetical protein